MAPKHRLYSPEIADDICEKLEEGMGLNAICQADGMPTEGAVRYWVQTDHDGFASRFASARERGLQHHADAIIAIADGANDSDSAAAARVQIDARKWVLSKLIPRTYGDRLELSGEVGIKDLTDEHVQSRTIDLLRTAGVVGALGGASETQEPSQAPRLLPGDGTSET